MRSQQQGVHAVFNLETTLRSQLVQPKDAVNLPKQNGVVYRIPCECGEVFIGESGRPTQDRIKESTIETSDSPIPRPPLFQSMPTISDKVKFIDHDTYHYTCRVKEAIHIRLHPHNINRESEIEIPEEWMPMIKKHNNRRAVWQWTTKGANH